MKPVILTGLDMLYPTKQYVQELLAHIGVGGHQYWGFGISGNILRYRVANSHIFRRGYKYDFGLWSFVSFAVVVDSKSC